MSINIGNQKNKLYIGNAKVSKAYLGSTKIYSSGNVVTYIVDANNTYMEEFEEGESVLSPKTFTPTKPGWVFMGWRTDESGSVLTSLYMDDSPITLYAHWVNSTVDVTNSDDHITYTGGWSRINGKQVGRCRAFVNDLEATGAGTNNPNSATASLTLKNIEPYKKAIIKLQPHQENTTAGAWYEEGGNWAKLWINGTLVMDSKSQDYDTRFPGELTYTLTSSDKALEFEYEARITGDDDGKYTWCYSGVEINSIVLSM